MLLISARSFLEIVAAHSFIAIQVLSNGVVRPVSTRETAHIQQLVALQKKPKPRSLAFFISCACCYFLTVY